MKPGRSWPHGAPFAAALTVAALALTVEALLPAPRPHPGRLAAQPVVTATTAPAATAPVITAPAVPHAHPRPAATPAPTPAQTPAPVPSPSVIRTPSPAPAPSPTQTSIPVPAGSAQAYAYAALARYGWPVTEFACLLPLWERESGWRNTAEEPTTGAYGIPQSNHHGVGGAPYPASYEAANPPWYGGTSDADTQVDWGLVYVRDSYGSPCGAWNHELAVGWY